MNLHLKRMIELLKAHQESLRVANLTVESCMDQSTAAMNTWKEMDVHSAAPDEWMAAKDRFDRSHDRVLEAQEVVGSLLSEGDRLITRAATLRGQG